MREREGDKGVEDAWGRARLWEKDRESAVLHEEGVELFVCGMEGFPILQGY